MLEVTCLWLAGGLIHEEFHFLIKYNFEMCHSYYESIEVSRLMEELNNEQYMWHVCLYFPSSVLPVLSSLSVSGYKPHPFMNTVGWGREMNGSFDLEDLVF